MRVCAMEFKGDGFPQGEPERGQYWTQASWKRGKNPNLPVVIICCPGCEQLFTMNAEGQSNHELINVEPLTISPSIVCPDTCHYFIRDNQVQWV